MIEKAMKDNEMKIVMYKINHFLFLKGSYEINWYEERRRNTRQKKKKKKTKSLHIRNLKN